MRGAHEPSRPVSLVKTASKYCNISGYGAAGNAAFGGEAKVQGQTIAVPDRDLTGNNIMAICVRNLEQPLPQVTGRRAWQVKTRFSYACSAFVAWADWLRGPSGARQRWATSSPLEIRGRGVP